MSSEVWRASSASSSRPVRRLPRMTSSWWRCTRWPISRPRSRPSRQTSISTPPAAYPTCSVPGAVALASPTGAAASARVAVRAPASGAVLSVITESAGVISEGTPLMAIGDPRRIEVVVDLLSREAVPVKPGDRVEITQWGGDEPLIGQVERIEPFGRLKLSALGIEEQRVNVIISFVAASAPQAARLGHGFQVDATILLWARPDAVRVPIGALFRGTDGGWRTFVVDGDRVRERAIKIGHVNDEFGEVLDGLAEGQGVIVNPGNSLADGKRIKVR